MAIIHNLVSGNASSTSQYGIQITTSTLVTELQNTSGTVQLDAAISQVGIGIGTRHPDFPIYTCIDISAQSAGPNEVEITYTWEYRFPEIRYEISGNIISEQTNIDADGNVITSSYTYPASYTENPELAGEEFTTSILVDAYVPETVISITRQEYIPPVTGLALIEKSKIFTGTVNTGGWLGMAAYAHTWLCTGISGSSQDNGITYSVRYTFAHRRERLTRSGGVTRIIGGWDKEVVFIDPRTDQPPEDATSETYNVYPEADFNILGLI